MRRPHGKTIRLILGLSLSLSILIQPKPHGLSPQGQRVVAVASLMVAWWITEAVPIPVTSLIPLVLLLLPAVLSASCAFMLPVATPPNAVVFGSGLLTIRQMARTGLILNIIGIIVISAVVLLIGPLVFNEHFSDMSGWMPTR